MKAGAFHVLEKPFQPHELVEQIARAMEQERERFERIRIDEATVRRLKELTPREREVLNLLLLAIRPSKSRIVWISAFAPSISSPQSSDEDERGQRFAIKSNRLQPTCEE